MNPGALVPDVGHLEEVGVQSRLANGVAEDGLVGARRAGGDNDPVQSVLGDALLDQLQGVGGTGVDGVLGEDNVGQGLGVVYHGLHVHHPGDVRPAGADEHPDARLVGDGHGNLQWIDFFLDQGAALGADQR